MTKKQKKTLLRILIAALLLAAVAVTVHFVPMPQWAKLLLFVLPYLAVGHPVLYDAAHNIVRGNVFDEKFLMTLATMGAFFVGEYPEATFVMLFFEVGELFESIAVGKSRRSVAALTELCADTARLVENGQTREVSPEEVAVGMHILVQPGERIPLDGIITEGTASLDTAALTGESLPRTVRPDDAVLSGCICTDGVLTVRVTKPYEESTVARILELVENAGIHKAKSEKFITRFAKYYTPCVVAGALLLGIVPPLFSGSTGDWSVWSEWISRAMVFLVISCPCALVISVPLSFFGGIGGASAKGILVKGSDHLEHLSMCSTVVFDKTGTLTNGTFSVKDIRPCDGITQETLLRTAASAESRSNHPLAKAVCAAAATYETPETVHEQAGLGVTATIGGKTVAVGSRRLMEQNAISVTKENDAAAAVYVAQDGKYMGSIVLSDTVKPDAAQAIAALRKHGVRRICMLTGDREQAAAEVAAELGIDEVYASLLPEDKVRIACKLRDECKKGEKLAFVGDGINDAPVLTCADVGIAMGAFGSDAAIEAADVVLMNDRPTDIAAAMAVSVKTKRIVKQNIVFALGVKFAVLLLSAVGIAGMGIGIFADVGVCVLAVCNAMRTQYGRF